MARRGSNPSFSPHSPPHRFLETMPQNFEQVASTSTHAARAGSHPGGARCYGLTTLKVPPKAWIPLPLPTDPVRIGLPIPSTAGCSWL